MQYNFILHAKLRPSLFHFIFLLPLFSFPIRFLKEVLRREAIGREVLALMVEESDEVAASGGKLDLHTHRARELVDELSPKDVNQAQSKEEHRLQRDLIRTQ